jgi:predicted acylesterase/phospholipase RssA
MNPLSVVGRATSAAPGYFNPLSIGDMTFLDGGLVANNPTHYAYHEVRQLQGNRPPKCVLSIGTGKKNKRSFKRLKKFFPHWAPFISLELNNKIAESESAHDQMRIELDQRQVDVDAIEYDRLTVDTDFGLGWMKLDEWKRKASSTTRARDAQPIAQDFQHERDYLLGKRSRHHDTVEFLETRTTLYLAQDGVQNQLQRLARVLVETRRQRSRTWKWEHFATGETWQCPIRSDNGCNGDKFNTQRDLERHLSDMHREGPHRATRECVIPY